MFDFDSIAHVLAYTHTRSLIGSNPFKQTKQDIQDALDLAFRMGQADILKQSIPILLEESPSLTVEQIQSLTGGHKDTIESIMRNYAEDQSILLNHLKTQSTMTVTELAKKLGQDEKILRKKLGLDIESGIESQD